MLGDIVLNKKIPRPKVILCKPDKTQITTLHHIKGLEITLKYAQISEVSFSVPYYIVKNHEKTLNAIVNQILYKYLLLIDGEYYEVQLPKRTSEGGKEYLHVSAYLLPYELRNKLIYNYEETKNPRNALIDALNGTGWSVDYISPLLTNKYRTFKFESTTVLDFIFQIEESFLGVLQFNTTSRNISLYDKSELDTSKDFVISTGKYLKVLTEEYEDNNIYTSIRPEGADGIGIQLVSPNGGSSIVDISYFMNLKYMSQSLIDAENLYQSKINAQSTTFKSKITLLNTYTNDLNNLNNELTLLNIGDPSYTSYTNDTEEARYRGLQPVQKVLDSLNMVATKTSEQITQINHYNVLKGILDGLIASKNSEIANKNSQITTVKNEISVLQSDLSLENNFTTEQLNERQKFILEFHWQDTNYTENMVQELYDDAVKKLQEFRYPRVSFSIDIVDLLSCINEQRNWNKIVLGDNITVKHKLLGIDIQAKIMEIQHAWDDKSLKLVIANIKDRKQFEKIYKNASYASGSLNRNKNRFDDTKNNNSFINDIINDKLKDVVDNFKITANDSVEYGKRGLLIKDLDNPNNNYLHANHQGIATVLNGQYKSALTSQGIVGESIYGKQIIGVDGLFQGIEVLNTDGSTLATLGIYGDNKRGLQIQGGSLEILGSISPSLNYSNNIIMDTNGLVIQHTNKKYQATLSSTKLEFAGSTDYGLTWNPKLYYDAINNKLVVNGTIQCAELLDIDGLTMLSGKKIKAEYIDADNLTVHKALTLDAGAVITFSQISDQPFIPNDSYITTITSNTIQTTNVIAQNLKVKSANIDGKLTANQIETIGLGAEKIYKPSNPSMYAEIGGTYADFILHRSANEYFKIEDGQSSFSLVTRLWNTSIGQYQTNYSLNIGANSTEAMGVWNFSGNVNFNGTVNGIIAKFA